MVDISVLSLVGDLARDSTEYPVNPCRTLPASSFQNRCKFAEPYRLGKKILDAIAVVLRFHKSVALQTVKFNHRVVLKSKVLHLVLLFDVSFATSHLRIVRCAENVEKNTQKIKKNLLAYRIRFTISLDMQWRSPLHNSLLKAVPSTLIVWFSVDRNGSGQVLCQSSCKANDFRKIGAEKSEGC